MGETRIVLDEAYLDVTENKTGLPTATRVARAIRAQIREELNLTASAGVAPNKFLAKIASDWRKPDGLFVAILVTRLFGCLEQLFETLPGRRGPEHPGRAALER